MDFPKLTETVSAFGALGVPSCRVSVRQEHRTLLSRSWGFTEPAPTGESVCWLYSLTKLFTVTAALSLWEDGAFRLSDPVEHYLPEFARIRVRGTSTPLTEPMTLEHLFTMTGGISYNFREPALTALCGRGTTRDVAAAIAKMPLSFVPGEHFLYGFGHDVLAAVCEVITGKRFSEVLSERVFAPLEITDMGFFAPEEIRRRMPPQYTYAFRTKALEPAGWDNTFRIADGHESGGGGLYGSGESVLRLADALACGGTAWNGARLLKPETVEAMHTNRLRAEALRDFAAIGTVKPGYGYGLGVRTLTDPMASRGPVGEFGWSGAAGSYVLMDEENRVSLCYTQHVLNFLPAFDVMHNALRDALYEDLGY